MKYLTLLRHAKAERASAAGSDLARDLTDRGVEDARRTGSFLLGRFPAPGVIGVSAALRARRTVEELLYEQNNTSAANAGAIPVDIREELYLADPEDLWSYGYTALLEHDEVWICAHDPGITEAIERFSGSRIERVPTCGVARIAFEEMLPRGTSGSLLFFDLPANHRHR